MADDVLTLSKLTAMIKMVPVMEPNAGRVIESDHMVDGPFEDWSGVRSPSRARRRRARGHRQNIRHYYTPKPDFLKLADGTLICHPATLRTLQEKIGRSIQRRADEMVREALFGRLL